MTTRADVIGALDGLRAATVATPMAVAVTVAGGDALTYVDWDRRSAAAARGLAAAGVDSGKVVALSFGIGQFTELAVASTAVHKLGGITVPVPPSLKGADRRRVLDDCRPAAVVASDSTARGSTLMLGRLEAVGRQRRDLLPGDTAPHDDQIAELWYPSGVMRLPMPAARRWRQLCSERAWPEPLQGGLVHAWCPGTPAGQAALLWPLRSGSLSGPVVAVAGVDATAFLAHVVARRPAAVGLTSALARLLAASGGACEGVQVVLVDAGWTAERLESTVGAGLRRVFPGARVCGFPVDESAWPVPPGGAAWEPRLPAGVSTAPLTTAQQGMVWHEQFAPGSFSLPPMVRRLEGHLDLPALESALDELARRHLALRTTFSLVDGKAVQLVWPYERRRLPVIDLEPLGVEAALGQLHRLIGDRCREPLDLVRGPLFDPCLVRLGAEDHVMVIRAHHAVFDEWSVGLFRHELSALYRAFGAGSRGTPGEPPLAFAKLALDEYAELEAGRGVADLQFWRDELRGAPWTTELPIGDPDRPLGGRLPPTPEIRRQVPREVGDRLRALAAGERATPFMVCLAAFSVLVLRYTGQQDMVLCTLVANRERRGAACMIGCFAKKVPLRLRLGGNPTFLQLIARSRSALLGAMAHQAPAFETVIQDALGPPAAAHGLVPQVAVKFQSTVPPGARLRLPGLTPGPVPPGPPSPRIHFLAAAEGVTPEPVGTPWGVGLYRGTFLGLSVGEEQDGNLLLAAEGAFYPPAVERLLDDFAALLVAVGTFPDRRIGEVIAEMSPDAGEPDAATPATAEGQIPNLRGFRVDPKRVAAALASSPAVRHAEVAFIEPEPGEPRLVASIHRREPGASWDNLREHLWRELPGYAWPAEFRDVGDAVSLPTAPPGEPAHPSPAGGRGPNRAEVLAALWADVSKLPDGSRRRNYWQALSFLDAVAAGRRHDFTIPDRSLARNRTLDTLAADLGASPTGPA